MRISKRNIVLLVLLPLIIGSSFYLFRSYPPLFFPTVYRWHPQVWWQKLLLYSGPDFCWAYSLSCAVLYWSIAYSVERKLAALLAFSMVVLSEVVQVGAGNFTFDYVDIAAAVSAFILSIIVIKKKA